MKTVHARIEGQVQGVWYRGWTRQTARSLGLAGWVRNRSDGSVEALFHGPAAVVDEMLARCKDGPPAARVAAVHARPADEVPDGDGFEQLATV
ncbi:acylphosphatase [Caenispirillum bisanense]|uniref:acylphosphatase n=1 Tax=Caenispirillum bisanense TaxID=414052 RepID=A0A286GYM1_9PROT|nr:acylphosphatase [Caenispirillum bisanense]SOE00581.1 acylphosphatase [Caenispirillum bisanense]